MNASPETSAGNQPDFNEARYGKDWHPDAGPQIDDRLKLVLRLAGEPAGRKILDVGCYDGYVSRIFREKGFYTIGVDASPTAVAAARKNCDECHVLDLSKGRLPIPDGSVDIVWAGEVIEHVFDTESFAEDLYRVLKPGGRLILSTPNLACWINRVVLLMGLQPFFTEVGVRATNTGNFLRSVGEPAGHIRVFTLSSLKHLLGTCGWTVESAHGASLMERKQIQWLDKLISHAFPGLASDLVLVCKK